MLALTLTTVSYCGQRSRFFLFDGSTVEGEVVSFINGTYAINTVDAGQMLIGASKIRKMEAIETAPSATEAPAQTSSVSMKSEIDKVSSVIASNPQMSSQVSALASDPAIQGLLNDPEIVAAVKSGDIKTLLSNQKFMDLVNNQKIKELSTKVKEQKPQ